MEKIQFDIKYRDKIESGEYKVVAHEHEEQEVRIVCWDNKGEYPIVALIDNEPEKFDKHGRVPGGNRGGEFSLFLVTPMPELSEFEEAIGVEIFDPPFNAEHVKVIREESAKLLALATEELKKTFVLLHKNDYQTAFDLGKAEALKDLPRWKKCGKDTGQTILYKGFCDVQNYLEMDGYRIMLSDLKKLPGFNEK